MHRGRSGCRSRAIEYRAIPLTELPIVTTRNLGRRFGRHWAVRAIDINVTRGEMLGVVGPDASGKTTLLQMFAAILDPTEGDCRVFQHDARRESKRIAARIGYMTQGFTLYDRLSVEENLALAARLRGVAMHTVYAERRAQLLRMAGLEPFTARRAGQLSGGMRKKLSLCTNLIHQPELLILDEPGLGVDPLSRRQLWEMLEQFRARGITLIVATSYMDEAERCDRVVLLESGSMLAVDTPANVRKRVEGRIFEIVSPEPMLVAAQLAREHGPRAIQVLPDRVRFQTSAGVSAAALQLGTKAAVRAAAPTLEDVFTQHAAQPELAEPSSERRSEIGVTEGGITVSALTVDFGTFRAVDNASLAVERGQMLALLGPNGAGKTTLIRALCGLVRVAGGTAEVAGVPVGANTQPLRRRIGYMSQRFSLYVDLTTAENLRFFASAYGLGGAEAQTRVAWSCERTGIDPREPKLVASLSGAERQRLALACSIIHQPGVLFLDEPTSGIDPAARYRFWWLIRSLAAEGMTVLVTTHYLDEAAYCDRIGLMDRGRVVAAGSLAELRNTFAGGAQVGVEAIFVAALERARSEGMAA
jgi:ABC-2 type transport system ATP-binding protein